MAFVRLIFTANNLNKLKNELIEEKRDAVKAARHEKRKKKFRHIGVDVRVAFRRCFGRICRLPEDNRIHRTCFMLRRDGSCENYTLKSVFGFFGGILLTYLMFIFFVFQLNVKLTTATVLCSMMGCILTIGLAFSTRVRCIVLLTLPQFFSRKGRQALLAYGFILTLTGPAQNTLNNMGILSESLACGQEQLKQAVRQIIEVIKKPFVAIKEAIKKVVKTVKEVVKKIKEILMKIKKVIMSILRVIKAAFEFLGKIINICNKELGTPFERCTRVFESAIADCNAKLGPLFSWLCSITYIVKAVCYVVKIFDYVCMLVDFISDSIIGVVIRKVKMFVRQVKTTFYVRIKFSHSFKFETTASKNLKEIAQEIVAEIKDRSKRIVAFFNFMTSAAMLFFLFMVFQVTYYRFKFLTSERFDNIYITKYFRQIDMRRAKLSKETVLPLNKRERNLYVPINSLSLAKLERKQLTKALTMVATATLKMATHMAGDYCLYWVLNLISYHGRYQSKMQLPNMPTPHVTGEGLIAKLLKAIVKAFQPVGINLEIDTVPCLPIPIPPDLDRYVQIAIVLVICWFLTFLEPYGLRFRNYIMSYYHPTRAKQRTIWLYNHILRSRTSFLKFARRLLRRKFFGAKDERITCKEYLRANMRCWICRVCLGDDLQTACLVCGEVFRDSDPQKPIRCHTPGCPGVFCVECFAELQNVCPICLAPIEYGDVEDEEKYLPDLPIGISSNVTVSSRDSSDEEEPKGKAEIVEAKEEGVSDSSTDYSYSYQYDEPQTAELPPPLTYGKDVEKQHIPDYASMDSFREDAEDEATTLVEVDIDNKLRIDQGQSAFIKLSIASQVMDDSSEEDVPLLQSVDCQCSDSEDIKHVEFVGLDEKNASRRYRQHVKLIPASSGSECVCSELEMIEHLEETSFVTLPKSTMSTSTRTDCLFCQRPNLKRKPINHVVPQLDLSFVNEDFPRNQNRLNDKFRYVTYEEVSESPTVGSSSALSNPPSRRNQHLRRRRQDSRQRCQPPSDSPRGFESSRTRNRNVKEYYEATRNYPSGTGRIGPMRTNFVNLFKKLLPKIRFSMPGSPFLLSYGKG
ncbi:DC-STAMP domain-containing protein 2-like [Cylas formicarius]|uniref:DC-STAMP domain-containing protein 2-like n=1 Tax=Cylas formicarius TaxID=197179 RepID=UPI002958BDBA|nr:DC-STAMP domain-containing protein 2-like [Cylas formicarius]